MLTCPLCLAEVAPRSASCRGCRLPIGDVARHQKPSSPGGLTVPARLWGLVAYAVLALGCVVALPVAAAFVVPAATAAAVLHLVKGRPVLAALVFVAVVALAPPLLWPSTTTDVVGDLGSIL